MRSRKKIFLYLFLILIAAAAFTGWKLFGPTINSPEAKYFYISTGSTYQQVKESLVKNKIITGAWWFDKVAKYLHYERTIRPGKYKIDEGTNLVNLVRMLRAGKQSPVNLVINKLRTKEDLAKKIGDNFECDSLSVSQFLYNTDSLSKYGLDTNLAMTAIIPNTYTFTWNNTPSRIFKKLYLEEEKFWNEGRKQKAARLNLDKKQVYILASIVEEETNKQDDKGKIASVYLNRMNNGMKLAADPTVKYAMRDFGLKRIYFKHLSYPSPYNTYQNAGLPPGPICTPSLKTIDAVLDEPATDYLFFVAKSDFSGYSNFAANFSEHSRYAKQYQQALDSIIKLKQLRSN